jgi:hypothetical protein
MAGEEIDGLAGQIIAEVGKRTGGVLRDKGGGFPPKSKDQPHGLAYAPGATMPAKPLAASVVRFESKRRLRPGPER